MSRFGFNSLTDIAKRPVIGYFSDMKPSFVFAILLLAVAPFQVRAQQSPDDQYVSIYGEMQQADSLSGTGQGKQALADYIDAQSRLQKFQKIYPDWNQKIVNFRLKYIAGQIADLSVKFPQATNSEPQVQPVVNSSPTPASSETSTQPNTLQSQVQNLQSENATLQAKLKEALAIKPATDSAELARAQAQIQSLMKQNDLLKASQSEKAPTIVTNIVEKPVANSDASDLKAQVAALQTQLETAALEKQALEDRLHQAISAAPANPPSDSTVAPTTSPVSQTPAVVPPQQQIPVVDNKTNAATGWPDGSEQYVAQAQNYFAAKQYDKAIGIYQKLLKISPDNPLVLGNLATIELEQGNLDDAETNIKAALAKSPDDAYNLSILGYLKFRQQKFDEAASVLSRASQLDPNNSETLNYLGVTLGRKGMNADAEKALRKAIELSPDYAAAHNNLAVIYLNEQPPSVELARLEYQKAISLGQPHNSNLEKMLAAKGAPVSQQ